MAMATPGELGADDREFEEAEPAHRFLHAVAIERRECLTVLGQVAGDLVHLRGLVHRTADEQDAFLTTHVLSSHRVLNVPATNTTTANAAVTPTARSVAASSTKIIDARSASFT